MNPTITVTISVVLALLTFGIGIIIGHFAIKKSDSDSSNTYLTRPEDPNVYKKFIDKISAENIRINLRNLTSRSHMAGTPQDFDSADFIRKRWENDGLQVFMPRYNVLLSYPNNINKNQVILKSNTGSVLFQTNGTETLFDLDEEITVDPFLAYTPGGTVNSTKLYYGNYGRLEDLEHLANAIKPDTLNGSIIIMRYGKIFRGDKVMHAQKFGAIGAILYNDPLDYAPFGIEPENTYNQTWYMPPSGAQRGSTYILNGDPLTPTYPSKDYMHRQPESNLDTLPKIVAHPVGYNEAIKFMEQMSGKEVNSTWTGRLPNLTYKYGGTLNNNQLIEIRSYNKNERRNTYNVVGIMKGEIEPDRYVVIGNHRDAWSLGAVDPTSGTATLLEITRVLGEMYKEGFRPRRSMMFCSWGAEEYGLIGSVEYVQEYVKVLGARIVSYLNLDIAVEGNHTIDVSSSPMLFDAIIQAGKLVPSAYETEKITVYDKWMKVARNPATNEPHIAFGLGSGSDYLAFDQLVGSSNFDASYTFEKARQGNVTFYPLYHTSYEVFPMVEKFIDPKFEAHQSMGRFTGVLALILAESLIIPMNVTRYGSALQEALNDLKPIKQFSYKELEQAIGEFVEAAAKFNEQPKLLDMKNPYAIRIFNDQLLQVERAFLNPLGQGGQYSDMKHVVYAPAKTNKYAGSGFPSLGDALSSDDPNDIDYQVKVTAYYVHSATSVLKEFNNFITIEKL